MAHPNPSLLPAEYLPVLDEINRLVIASGEPLEGNLFYFHEQDQPGRHNIYDYFQNKRDNFAAACRAGSRMLEVGVGAGHSALLAMANGVEYHGVDIGEHSYTRPVAEFLKHTFGPNFNFYDGDSLTTLTAIHLAQPELRFNLLHIDGNHGIDYCRADSYNAMLMAQPNAWIMVNDTDLPDIREFFADRVAKGVFTNEKPAGWRDNPHHAIGRVNLD